MWNALPTYLNQDWECATSESGVIGIVSGQIRENVPTNYDQTIAVLEDSPVAYERASLIANAPNMFRLLCNVMGEVKYGTATLPEEIAEGIDDVLRDIARHE